MSALPAVELDLDERIVTRLPADPFVRVDTNDYYSLDPVLVGRRVGVPRLIDPSTALPRRGDEFQSRAESFV